MESNYDVIVAGASNSGGMAACTAAEKGAKVLLIDKMGDSKYLYRSSIAAVDSNAQKKAGIKIDKAKLINFLTLFAQSNVDQRLLWKWVNNSAETVNWLEDNVLKPNGGHIMAQPDARYETLINTAFPVENVIANEDDTDWAHYGSWVINKAQELGVTLQYNTKLEDLITNESYRHCCQ